MALYEGCHVVVYQESLAPIAEPLKKALTAEAARVIWLAGCPVFVFERKSEEDYWEFFVALPHPNVVLFATEETYLEEVLERREQKARPTFLRNRFHGWQQLDRKAPFWAIRYFPRDRHDAVVVRLTFSFNPATNRAPEIVSFSSNPEVLDSAVGQEGSSNQGIKTVVHQIGANARRVRFFFKGAEGRGTFLFLLLGLLGHEVRV